MPVNRVVALAAPLAAPLAGAFAAWLSQQFPGFDMPREALEEVFLAATALAFGLAFQFNHNRFKWDVMEEHPEAAEGMGLEAGAGTAGMGAAGAEELDEALDEDALVGADDESDLDAELAFDDDLDDEDVVDEDLEDEDFEDDEELLEADTDRVVHAIEDEEPTSAEPRS